MSQSQQDLALTPSPATSYAEQGPGFAEEGGGAQAHLKAVLSVAVLMLSKHYPQDVEATFSPEELADLTAVALEATAGRRRVEAVYRAAFDHLLSPSSAPAAADTVAGEPAPAP